MFIFTSLFSVFKFIPHCDKRLIIFYFLLWAMVCSVLKITVCSLSFIFLCPLYCLFFYDLRLLIATFIKLFVLLHIPGFPDFICIVTCTWFFRFHFYCYMYLVSRFHCYCESKITAGMIFIIA